MSRWTRGASRSTVIVVAALFATACVDHDSNSETFCRRNAELLDESQDGAELSEDQAIFTSDEVEKSMRYAEDGTRTVRRAARELADAYADVREIADDDDPPEDEVDDVYDELEKRRQEMREVCGEVLES